MSVYTTVSQQQLENLLALYPLGSLISFKGIQAGIENTNYAVTTTQGDFVLTVFESLTIEELPPYLSLLNHFCQHNFPAPKPQMCNTGQFLNVVKGKTAALFNHLPGHSIENPSLDQCEEVGGYLAKLHLHSIGCNFDKKNSMNLAGCQLIFDKIKPHLTKDDIKLLNSELNFQSVYPLPALPQGIIHADLFKDNVLFKQGHISGILDFYNACNDNLLFDIAVTCNDWCVDSGTVNKQKLKGLLSGYNKVRTLNNNEIEQLSIFLRLAALRFWLSRLDHQLNPKDGEITLVKDPLVFREVLKFYRTNSYIIP